MYSKRSPPKPLELGGLQFFDSQRTLAIYYWFVRSDLSDIYHSEHSI